MILSKSSTTARWRLLDDAENGERATVPNLLRASEVPQRLLELTRTPQTISENIEELIRIADQQLDIQHEVWKVAEERPRWVVGFLGFVLLAVQAVPRSIQPPDHAVQFAPGALGIASILWFLAAGAIAGHAVWPQSFDRPPHPIRLVDAYVARPRSETRQQVLNTMLKAYERNEHAIAMRNRASKRAFLCAGISVTILCVSVAVDVALHTVPFGA